MVIIIYTFYDKEIADIAWRYRSGHKTTYVLSTGWCACVLE